jgi:hypothetical protein
MASELSTFAALYDAADTRIGGPNLSEYDRPVRMRTDTVTLTEAANASGDYYDLGPAMFEGQVIPNESFLSYDTGSTGTLNTTFTLSKYNATDGVVDLSGLATGSGAVADYFLDFAAVTTLPTVTKSDRLRLYLTTVTTATAGRTIKVNICYIPKHGN